MKNLIKKIIAIVKILIPFIKYGIKEYKELKESLKS